MRKVPALAALAAVPLLAAPAAVVDLIDRASVIEATRSRFTGSASAFTASMRRRMDRPCDDADSKPYRCCQCAALGLADGIGADTVVCEQRDVDRYGRIVAGCFPDGLDLGAWRVTQALAVDYPTYSGGAYAGEEAEARDAGGGMWAGSFIPPWEWRQSQRQPVMPSFAASRCRLACCHS